MKRRNEEQGGMEIREKEGKEGGEEKEERGKGGTDEVAKKSVTTVRTLSLLVGDTTNKLQCTQYKQRQKLEGRGGEERRDGEEGEERREGKRGKGGEGEESTIRSSNT